MNNHLPPIQPSQQQPLDHQQQIPLNYGYYYQQQPAQASGTAAAAAVPTAQPIAPAGAPRLPFPSPSMPSPDSASDVLSNTSSPHVGGVRRRPSSSLTADTGGSTAGGSGSNKRARRNEEDDGDSQSQSPAADGSAGVGEVAKPKTTRGSRACTFCRRLKMKCVGAEQGPPCKRCISGNHECIFEESHRGKRSLKKTEMLTQSIHKLEKTLDTVLRSIGNPSIASGMISRSPSPSAQVVGTQALLASPPTPPPQSSSATPGGGAGGAAVATGTSHHRPQAGSPKLHSLPDNALNPLGLLAEASLANRRAQAASVSSASHAQAQSSDENGPRKLGVASDLYFKPGPMTILPLRRLYIERQVQPEMLSFVNTEDVVALFRIFFDNVNVHCNLLDRDFHTPSLVCSRSPFLLTTMCAIASKFYEAKPELHLRLTDIAKDLAFSVPAQGYKSVEIVQAYLLLALWGCGAVERYEQDKTWLMLGMAIRMGTDLNLHRKTATTSQDTPEGRARDKEVHIRERTWLLCFCLDRSFSSQMGKPYSIKEDWIIRNSATWAGSPQAIPSDPSLAAYVELQRTMTRGLDLIYSSVTSPSGMQVDCDYYLVIRTTEAHIQEWHQHSINMSAAEESVSNYRRLVAGLYSNYNILVMNSFGLQNALERSPADIGYFFVKAHSAATQCAILVRDTLGPSGYLRYSPDSHFVLISYALLSLLKFTKPEFRPFLDDEKKTVDLVRDAVDMLERVAVNPHHTPALYSYFLRAVISAKVDGLVDSNGAITPEKTTGDGSAQLVAAQSLLSSSSSSDRHAGTTAATSSGAANTIGDMGPPTDTSGYLMSTPPPPPSHHHQGGGGPLNGHAQTNAAMASAMAMPLNEFQFNSEMGPIMDMSTFPPTIATMAAPGEDQHGHPNMISMDSILSTGFWDSMLVPGYSNIEGLSGGFVFGAGGSGLITPRMGITPLASRDSTPARGVDPAHFDHREMSVTFGSGDSK